MEDLRASLSKPLNRGVAGLVLQIERRPMMFLGGDIGIRSLFHFLNGWQLGAREDQDHGEAGLNEKMNAFLALKYNDFDTLNWKMLLIRHEGEDAAFDKFFECFHLMESR